MLKVEQAYEEKSVAALYQDAWVAGTYVEKRFAFSWSRLLHQTQVTEINRVIDEHRPEMTVEVAPGPARLTTGIRGIRKGVLIEYSQEMLAQAKRRLEARGLGPLWEVCHGNAFHLEDQRLQCDFLYTFRFIRHFMAEDRTRLYKNFHLSLKPGGLLMFDVVNKEVRQKIDARKNSESNGELDVYDVTYSVEEFSQEMADHGFTVLFLKPVIRQFELQSWISYTFDRRIGKWADCLVRLLEKIPSPNPLEWIALSRKID
ncbi:MAG: class I SAM-dependent methyltransferase [Nitrospinae bacterium]|nr:class I SAM-dependent methyltransferase [Nitrospinota bacterium]